MTNLLDKIKEYINDITNNVKEAFFNDDLDKINLDEIIEREYKKAIEGLRKFKIIEYIERKYNINYIEPELEIIENGPFTAQYSHPERKVSFSKESIKRWIDEQLKFLDYKKEREIDKLIKSLDYKEIISDRQDLIEFLKYGSYYFFSVIGRYTKFLGAIDKQLESLGYKKIEKSTNDTQDIGYLNMSHNSILFYPFYINKRNIRKAIAKFIIRSIMFHEFLHSIDYSILDMLKEDFTIKDKDYLSTILKDQDNLELRASAFEVIMYYLVNGFHKDERGYIAAYANIPICRKYVEKIHILEKNRFMEDFIPYDLGRCYGNIIVAKYGSSLEENIDKIIDDIIYLDKEKAIEVIKNYIYNPDKLLHDKNSNKLD
jgi:hypothetical protein